MSHPKRKVIRIEVYCMPHTKRLISYYADLKGLSASAFMLMIFSDWKDRNEKK